MTRLHLAVALDGAGWHPAAWRERGARPTELLSLPYWTELVTEAERGLLDFVTFEDALGLQSAAPFWPDERTDQVRGRLDAVVLAAGIAPHTSRIGLVPTTNVTLTEPLHTASGIASLSYASQGRAGWRPQVAARAADAAHVGRRNIPALAAEDVAAGSERIAAVLAELYAEAADVIDTVKRLWGDWENDRPLITVLAHATTPYRLAATGADIVYVTPHSRADAVRILEEVRAAADTVGRPPQEVLKTFADLVVFLDDRPGIAAHRKMRLDELDGAELASDAAIFTGTPGELADLILDWAEAGLDGFRLRPGVLSHDLTAISTGLVLELQRRGAFRTTYEAGTLRELLGLSRTAGHSMDRA